MQISAEDTTTPDQVTTAFTLTESQPFIGFNPYSNLTLLYRAQLDFSCFFLPLKVLDRARQIAEEEAVHSFSGR